ncbi:MAG TPA: hypothetical protein VGS98_10625 [Thermoanaerobaculia bacterium]|nr:hypothetical protein [Thermoanaerobaculia bacterium]
MARNLRTQSRWLAAVILAALPSVALPEGLESEDRGLAIERRQFNLLANSSLVSRAATDNVAIPQWMTVSGASNAIPIEMSTPIPHGLATGDTVLIKGVSGNVAANGWWTVTATGERTFALDDSAGSGIYAGGGSVFPSAGQPPLPGARDASGDLPWTPWFSAPAVARETEFFQPTGEVYTFPEVPPVNSFLSQEIDGSLFHAGENLCLSIEARMPESAIGVQRLKMIVTAAFRRVRVYGGTYPAAQLTPEYQRIALCFRLDSDAVTDGGVLRVEFIDEHLGGMPKPMFWTRPMLNEGVAPAPWTPNVEPMTRARAFR